jgi:hypothetical protein
VDDTPEQDDVAERAHLEQLFALADEIIAAGFDVLTAAVWRKPDGTLAKAPLHRHGHLEAHRDHQLIRQQLASPAWVPDSVPKRFEIVVGFVPGSGGCGVLDCDVKLGKGGVQSLKALVGEHGNFVGAAWRTPSGGINVLFQKPADTQLTNFSPWTGIDVRADNGWVVSPSNHSMHGRWEWMPPSSFRSARSLPTAMLAQLRTGEGSYERTTTNAATVAFIETSPETSSLPAMQAFAIELEKLRQAGVNDRHATMKHVMSWAWGMKALDLRWVMDQVTGVWLELVPGEGRDDEVKEYAKWVTAQEMTKRAAEGEATGSPTTGDDHPSIFIDWHEFARRDTSERQWLVEGFWPRGRAMALWAGAKEGKSELVLWCVGCLALGRHPWTGTPVEPVHIAYFDFEMNEDDLEERLSDFDFEPEDLGYLHYAVYPPLHPLDTEAGGQQLADYVAEVKAQAVVIDTFSRVITGEEDKADTVQSFYRHTAIRLKQMGIGYLRLDHAGKDPRKGQRGTSAKRDDVDVVWRQSRTDEGVSLDCSGSTRLSWVGPHLRVKRTVSPGTGIIRYSAPVHMGWTEGALAKARELDDLGAPVGISKREAIDLLKSKGVKPGRITTLLEALRFRKGGSEHNDTSATSGPQAGNGEPGGNAAPDDLFSE